MNSLCCFSPPFIVRQKEGLLLLSCSKGGKKKHYCLCHESNLLCLARLISQSLVTFILFPDRVCHGRATQPGSRVRFVLSNRSA